MNEIEYKHFYDRVGKLNGWDFSKVKCTTEGEQWNFYDEVSARCNRSDILLDIGTGGGEKLLSISDAALLLVGMDNASGMIESARANLRASKTENVCFMQMEADKIEFPGQFFNIVSCRQAPFNAEEVARVLTDDGLFLTQQVSEGDKRNIVEAFGRNHAAPPDRTLKNKYISELQDAGFTEIQSFEYDATEYYRSYEDLIFLLTHTPIVSNFGQAEHDFAALEQFISENQTDKGIRTNSERFMIIARK